MVLAHLEERREGRGRGGSGEVGRGRGEGVKGREGGEEMERLQESIFS